MLTRAYLEEVSFSVLAEGTARASTAQYTFLSRQPGLRRTQVMPPTPQLLHPSSYTSRVSKTGLAENVPAAPNYIYFTLQLKWLFSILFTGLWDLETRKVLSENPNPEYFLPVGPW